VERTKAVGYIRVSTAEQGESGAGLEAQRRAIKAACKARGWTLVTIHEDHASSGKSMNRNGVQAALASVDSHQADVLVVARLDRLSRSLVDFAALMVRSRKKDWGLVALDLGVDTTTPAGELMANVMASVAQSLGSGRRTPSRSSGRRACGSGAQRCCRERWSRGSSDDARPVTR
jgi:DNA invertase Pin-like site-specific DNA recombinase